MELLSPAGNLAALKAAINAGADAVYVGLNNSTNARSFAGLNFTTNELLQAVEYCHNRARKIYFTLNTYPSPGQEPIFYDAIDFAAKSHMDAIIIADLSLLEYTKTNYPTLEIHLSVQASANNSLALKFYQEQFNIKRAVLPRVLTLRQVEDIKDATTVELEIFAYGSLCIMAEGKCQLSSYVTSQSPNSGGSCSPAKYVRWSENNNILYTKLNDVLLDKTQIGNIGYPVICKGRYICEDKCANYSLEKPTSLSTLELIPQFANLNISSLKIEGRQRSPAYVAEVTKVWREALDSFKKDPDNFNVDPIWQQRLCKIAEGQATTLGAYQRAWQ